jgi:hypothetical protein
MWTHPAIQTELIMAGAGGRQNAGTSLWALTYGGERILFDTGYGTLSVGQMTSTLTIIAAAYILAGLLFLWRAKCRLRRNVFLTC